MENIIRAIRNRFSKRQRPSDGNGGLDVVEDSPYYPFSFHTNERGEFVVTLYSDDEYKRDLFEDHELTDDGYSWERLAEEYIKTEMPEAEEMIGFDTEKDMFYAYSDDEDTLKRFALGLLETCEDDDKLHRLMARIEEDKTCYDK